MYDYIDAFLCIHIYIYTYMDMYVYRYACMDTSFSLSPGCLSWLLLGWTLASAGAVFVPPGWILCHPGLHFESFVSLWGEPEAPGAVRYETFKKVRKTNRLGSSIGSLLGHILRPLPPKIEPASVLLRSFVSLFSRAFFAVLRNGFLEEIVESRRRPMCV